jgi:hypothetical protein
MSLFSTLGPISLIVNEVIITLIKIDTAKGSEGGEIMFGGIDR